MRAIAGVKLLILDDWELEPLGLEQCRDLLEIVEERYGRGATLITSHIPVDRWHDLIGDPTLADAILDRIIHIAHRLKQSAGRRPHRRCVPAPPWEITTDSGDPPPRPTSIGTAGRLESEQVADISSECPADIVGIRTPGCDPSSPWPAITRIAPTSCEWNGCRRLRFGKRRDQQRNHLTNEEAEMAVETVQDLFVDELRDIYSAEKQLTKALPKMAKAASHPKLKQAFELHLEQTRGQIERLDQVFEQLDMAKRAKKCEAMEGLIEEARSGIDEIDDPQVLDVGMIVNAQKIEHYEIAGYGSLVALARQFGHGEAAALLEETLEEEKATDQKLNEIAQTVNAIAGKAAEDDSSEEDSGRRSAAKNTRKAPTPASA